MREIDLSQECLDFFEEQEDRVSIKFFQLLEVMMDLKRIHSSFVKKLKDTPFYELRIKSGNEYRVVIFAIDHLDFNQCTRAICLNAFHKKSTKDYKKAISLAHRLLEEYLKEN